MRTLLILLTILALTPSCRIVGVKQISSFPSHLRCLSDTITVVSWNIQKGHDRRLAHDLRTLVQEHGPDLLFIQEARTDLMSPERMAGYFANSWKYPWPRVPITGVLTLSKVQPTKFKTLPTRWREFFVTAPKVALATEYPLQNGKRLLAVNVHLMNFERWGTFKLRSQMDDLKALISKHTGPIVLVGDFNTWNQRRLRLVTNLVQELQLKEVKDFSSPLKTGGISWPFLNWVLGIDKDLPLDRVYFRGLAQRSSSVLPYSSSDHKALHVTFSLNNESSVHQSRKEFLPTQCSGPETAARFSSAEPLENQRYSE